MLTLLSLTVTLTGNPNPTNSTNPTNHDTGTAVNMAP